MRSIGDAIEIDNWFKLIKTANQHKKMENYTKFNIIRCLWIFFCQNCQIEMDF